MTLLNSSRTLPGILREKWICKVESTFLVCPVFCNYINPVVTELNLAFRNLSALMNIQNRGIFDRIRTGGMCQINSQFRRQMVFLIRANVLFSVRYELFVL